MLVGELIASSFLRFNSCEGLRDRFVNERTPLAWVRLRINQLITACPSVGNDGQDFAAYYSWKLAQARPRKKSYDEEYSLGALDRFRFRMFSKRNEPFNVGPAVAFALKGSPGSSNAGNSCLNYLAVPYLQDGFRFKARRLQSSLCLFL